jgi:hypothetical protein
MQFCDDGSKYDACKYKLDPAVFARIQATWQVQHTVDAFPTAANRQLESFFSNFHCAGSAGEDFYEQPLDGEDVWMHPPRSQIGRAIRRLQQCRARGTVVVPHDSSEVWWPMVAHGARGTCTWTAPGATKPKPMRLKFVRRRGLLLTRGKSRPPGYRNLMVVRMDFRTERADTPTPGAWHARWQEEQATKAAARAKEPVAPSQEIPQARVGREAHT